ncbi:hypothetical protein D3C73_1487040 [compost metagenome]
MSQHGVDQFLVAESLPGQPQRRVGGHILAQQVARRYSHGGNECDQGLATRRCLQIVDDGRLNP